MGIVPGPPVMDYHIPGLLLQAERASRDCPCDSAYGEDGLREVVRTRKNINLDCGVHHGLKNQNDTLGSKNWWL